MIYLRLFLAFLKIGAVSFGGGYGMISLIRETVLGAGWLTEDELLAFIAVAESTPGPIAVNMATFVGSSLGGFWGAFLATLGVVLPSFCIILIIAALASGLLKRAAVRATLRAIRPCIVGMILATGAIMLASIAFGLQRLGDPIAVDPRDLLILALLALAPPLYKRLRGRPLSPILLILLSGGLGLVLFL